jgi:hypothetical protein
VYVNERLVDRVDPERARSMASGSNCEAVRSRAGVIVRINLSRHAEAAEDAESDSGSGCSYWEALGGHEVFILKRVSGRGFVRWTEKDGFDPRRFNPDRIPAPLRRS